ncbi:MAG: hypothetical protein ACR2PT_17200 [Endozoicomonas sp.]
MSKSLTAFTCLFMALFLAASAFGAEITPSQIRSYLESHGLEVKRCQILEGHCSCLPLSLVATLVNFQQTVQQQHCSGVVPTCSAWNRIHNRYAGYASNSSRQLSSIYINMEIQDRQSEITRSVIISHLLADTMQVLLNNPVQLAAFQAALEQLPIGNGFIQQWLTAMQAAIQEGNTQEEQELRHALLRHLQLALDQFDGAEMALLLAIATKKKVLLVDIRNRNKVRVLVIDGTQGPLSVTSFEINIEGTDSQNDQLAQLDVALADTDLHFVITEAHGLLPIVSTAEVVQGEGEVPRHLLATGEVKAQAVLHDLVTGQMKLLVATSDGGGPDSVPSVKSRKEPRLNPRMKKNVADYWRKRAGKNTSLPEGRSVAVSTVRMAAYLAVLVTAYYLAPDSLRQPAWKAVCGDHPDYRQCASDWQAWAAEQCGYVLEQGQKLTGECYQKVCGDMSLADCRHYYQNRLTGK